MRAVLLVTCGNLVAFTLGGVMMLYIVDLRNHGLVAAAQSRPFPDTLPPPPVPPRLIPPALTVGVTPERLAAMDPAPPAPVPAVTDPPVTDRLIAASPIPASPVAPPPVVEGHAEAQGAAPEPRAAATDPLINPVINPLASPEPTALPAPRPAPITTVAPKETSSLAATPVSKPDEPRKGAAAVVRETAQHPGDARSGAYSLQVGSFRVAANATRLAEILDHAGYAADIVMRSGAGGPLRIVRVNGFDTQAHAAQAASAIFGMTGDAALIVRSAP